MYYVLKHFPQQANVIIIIIAAPEQTITVIFITEAQDFLHC